MKDSAFLQGVHHAYAQTDGTYAWPNSREGDLLREAKREIDGLRDALKKANGQAAHFERLWYLRGDAIERAIEAWDSTVLPVSRDGMMQEHMERLRADVVPNSEFTGAPPTGHGEATNGQSRAEGANFTAVLDAARRVVECNAIVRERYQHRVHGGRIFQFSFDEGREHQDWLALQELEKSLDDLKDALEAAKVKVSIFDEAGDCPSGARGEARRTGMMLDYEIVRIAATNKLNELRADYDKLKAVDRLIGEDLTEQKKRELLTAIMAVQDVQSTIIDKCMGDMEHNG